MADLKIFANTIEDEAMNLMLRKKSCAITAPAQAGAVV